MKRSIFVLNLFLLATPAFSQGFVWHSGSGEGYLGVVLGEVSADDVKQAGLPSQTGAVVTEVKPDSPASEAGLLAGDVIVEVSGLPILSARQLQRVVADNPPERPLSFVIYRSGSRQELTVRLGQRDRENRPGLQRRFEIRPLEKDGPNFFQFRGPSPNIQIFGAGGPTLGIQGHTVTSELAQSLNLGSDKGVLVLEVVPDSPAQRAGIKPGDLIVSVSGEAIEDLDALRQSLKGDGVDIEVDRGGQRLNLTVQFDRKEGSRRGVRL